MPRQLTGNRYDHEVAVKQRIDKHVKMLEKMHELAYKEKNPDVKFSKTIMEKEISEEVAKELSFLNNLSEERISDIVNLGPTFERIKGKQNIKKKSAGRSEEVNKTYAKISKGFFEQIDAFEAHTNKINKGSKLIKDTIELDSALKHSHSSNFIHGSVGSARKAIDNFKKADKFIAFDLETLGGRNKYGYNGLDWITEFSFKVYEKTADGPVAVKTIENVVGFKPESKELDKAYNIIDKIKKGGTASLTEEESVYAKRLAKYGHKDTVIDEVSDGMFKVSKYVSDEAHDLFDASNMIRGAEKLEEVGKKQMKAAGGGMLHWEKQYAEAVDLMSNSGMMVTGHNVNFFDIPGLNQFNRKLSSDAQNLVKKSVGENMFINLEEGKVLDTMNIARIYEQKYSKHGFYESKGRLDLIDRNSRYFAQETLGQVYAPEMFEKGYASAHTASFDVDVFAKMVAGKENFIKDMDKFVPSAPNERAIKTGNQMLFVANNSYNFDRGASPLSFIKDPLDGSYKTFAGQKISGGVSESVLQKQYGTMKNVAYSLEWAKQMDMSEKFVKDIAEHNPEYAQGSMFGIKLNPITSLSAEESRKAHSPIYMMFKSKEEAQGYLNTMDFVAEKGKDGKFHMPEDIKDSVKRKYQKYKISPDGKKQAVKFGGVDDIIATSTHKIQNDSAARHVRDMNYKKAKAFDEFTGLIKKATGKSNPSKQEAQKAIGEIVAKQVSGGKKLGVGMEEIINTLGYIDGATKKFVMSTGTLDNTLSAYDALMARSQINSKVIKLIESRGDIKTAERNEIYKNIMSGLRSKAISDSSTSGKAGLFDSISSEVYAKDLNYFEVDISNMLGTGNKLNRLDSTEISRKGKDILRINLGTGADYSLGNNLLRTLGYSNNLSSVDKNAQALFQLDKLTQNLKSNPEYRDAFEEFSIIAEDKTHNYNDAKVASEEIVERLRNIKKKSPAAGIINPVEVQEVLEEEKLFKHINSNLSDFEEAAKLINKEIKPVKYIDAKDKKQLSNAVSEIVNSTLAPSAKEVKKGLIEEGFDDDEIKAVLNNLEQFKRDSQKGLEKVFGGFFNAGVEIAYDKGNGKILAIDKDEAIELHNIPKAKFKNGMLYVESGNTNIALHGVIDAKDAVKDGFITPSNIKYRTNIGMAYDEAFHLDKLIEKDVDEGVPILNRMQSQFSNLGKNLRGGTGRFGHNLEGSSINQFNRSEQLSMFRLDFTQVADMVPLIKGRDIKYRDEAMQELLERSDFGFGDVYTREKEILAKNVHLMLRDAANGRSDALSFAADKFSYVIKETEISEMIGSVGGSRISAGTGLNNTMRPVAYQMGNAQSFRRSVLETALREESNLQGGVFLGSKFFTENTLKTSSKVFDGMSEKTEDTIRTVSANMSNMQYSLMVNSAYAIEKQSGMLNESRELIYDNLRNANLFEQETIMDLRLMDMMEKESLQMVNARKRHAIDIVHNLDVIDELKDKSSLLPTMEIKDTGEIVFRYSSKGKYVERGEPVLKTLGYGKDNFDYFGPKASKAYMGFGYVTKGQEFTAKESEVEEVLNAFVKEQKQRNPGYVPKESELYEHLNSKYNAGFFFENIEKQNYLKMTSGNGAEKDMAHGIAVGLGKDDKRIAKLLKDIGQEDLIGLDIKEKHREELIIKKFDKLKHKNLFSSEDALREAIKAERYSANNELFDVMLKGTDVHWLTNHNMYGHASDFMSAESVVNTAIHKQAKEMAKLNPDMDHAMAEREASNKVMNSLRDEFKVFDFSKIRYEDGKAVMQNVSSETDNLNVNELVRFAEKFGITRDGVMGKGYGTELTVGGNFLGTVDVKSVRKMRDYEGISASAPEYTNDLINNLKAQIENEPDEIRRRMLSEDLAGARKVRSAIEKQFNISDREFQNLGHRKIDDGLLNVFNTAVFDDKSLTVDEAADALKGVIQFDNDMKPLIRDNSFVLKDDKKGQGVLSGYMDSLVDKLYDKYDGDVSVSQALGENPEKYVHLAKYSEIEQSLGRKIGLRTAEDFKGIESALTSMEFNSGRNNPGFDVDGLVSKGFEVKPMKDIPKSMVGDAQFQKGLEGSYLANDLLIDRGEDFTTNRYVAVPSLERLSGAGGEHAIKYDFQRQIDSLKRAEEGYVAAKKTGTESEVLAARQKYDDVTLGVMDALNVEVGKKKDGLIAQASTVKIDGKFSGKSSSVVLMDLDDIGKYGAETDPQKHVVEAYKNLQGKLTMEEVNIKALSDAKIDGLSVIEHYRKGRNVGATFLSEEAFNSMGFFTDSYKKELQNAVNKEADEIGTIAAKVDDDYVRNLLRTEGVMGLTSRHPVIKEGSIQVQHAFLNDSLAGNRMQLTAPDQLAMVGDNDGDTPQFVVFRDGKKDSLISSRIDKGNALMQEGKLAMYDRAVGVNKFWDAEVSQALMDDVDKTIKSGDFFTLTGDRKLDGRIYDQFSVMPGQEGIQKHIQDYTALKGQIAERTGASVDEIDFDSVKTYVSDLKSIADNFGTDEAMEAFESANKTARFEYLFGGMEREIMAKTRKGSIGVANVPLYNLRKLSDMSYMEGAGFTERQAASIQQFSELIEQEIISAKKGDLRYDLDKTKDFMDSLNGLLNNKGKVNAEAAESMKNWIFDNIGSSEKPEILSKEIEKLGAKGINFESIEELTNSFVDSLSNMSARAVKMRRAYDRIGESTRGVAAERLQEVIAGVPTSPKFLKDNVMHTVLTAGGFNVGMDDMKYYNAESLLSGDKIKYVDGSEWLKDKPGAGQTVKNIVSSAHGKISEVAKEIGGKNLAIGALGVAGAIMTAGFIGGNPSRPADTQANEAYEDTFYDAPMFDGGEPHVSGGKQQGYVININARSKKDIGDIESAVSSAIRSSTPTQVNVSMNVNDNTSRFTDNIIQDLISGAM